MMMMNIGLFFAQIWLHGNSLNSFENSGSTFEFTKPVKPYYTCEKLLDVLQVMEICAILALCLNLVAMATPLAHLKHIWYLIFDLDSIFEVANTNNLTIHAKNSLISCRERISAIFAYFYPNLIATATAVTDLKFYTAYLNSLAPKTWRVLVSWLVLCNKCLDFLQRTEKCNFGFFV